MGYASVLNQSFHLFHFFLAFTVVIVLVPMAMFTPVSGNWLDRGVAYSVRMILFLGLTGYALVLSKLYEVLGLIVCVLAWIFVKQALHRNRRARVSSLFMALFYDAIEGRYVVPIVWSRLRKRVAGIRQSLVKTRVRLSPSTIILVLCVGATVFSLWIRWYDSLSSAAPAMSDGYVTLAWIKYVDARYLFHDGIYPQGFYFYIAAIGKLSFINLVYVLKYTGALDSSLILLGLCYAVHRWTQSGLAVLSVVLLYGVFGQAVLGADWVRQAATNSQEFSFLLVAPTLVFVSRYLSQGDRVDFWTAMAGITATGLVHPMGYLLVVVGTIAWAAASAIFDYTERRNRVLWLAGGGLVSAVVALLPYGIGDLMGAGANTSSANFLSSVAVTPVPLPPLHILDYAALAAILLLLATSFMKGIQGTRPVLELAIGLYGAMVFGIYEFVGPATGSIVIISRSQDIWALSQVVCLAVAIYALERVLPGTRALRWGEVGVTIALSVAAWWRHPVVPIVPYKMQWESGVEQYLKIDSQYKYSGYMIVGPDEFYDLVLGGGGYHQATDKFVKMFNPTASALTKYGQAKPFTGIPTNVFIFYQKDIYEVDKQNSIYPLEVPIYTQEYADRTLLKEWLKQYEAHHNNLKIYYNGPHLEVYYIQTSVAKPSSLYYQGS